MLALKEALPDKKVFIKSELQHLLQITDRQAWDKIYYLRKRGVIDTVRRGVFVNLLKEEFGEEEKIQIAAALFPEGYVTGYEALRYWSMMRAEYEGLCLRVDWTIHSAVPQVVSKPVVWKGYRFKSFQMSPTLSFGIEKTPDGRVAEPEKAVLDLLYMGREPDNIEVGLLQQIKLKHYARQFPPRISELICR